MQNQVVALGGRNVRLHFLIHASAQKKFIQSIFLMMMKKKTKHEITANTMANGKDFFLELRKQFSALQQGGGERAGG